MRSRGCWDAPGAVEEGVAQRGEDGDVVRPGGGDVGTDAAEGLEPAHAPTRGRLPSARTDLHRQRGTPHCSCPSGGLSPPAPAPPRGVRAGSASTRACGCSYRGRREAAGGLATAARLSARRTGAARPLRRPGPAGHSRQPGRGCRAVALIDHFVGPFVPYRRVGVRAGCAQTHTRHDGGRMCRSCVPPSWGQRHLLPRRRRE